MLFSEGSKTKELVQTILVSSRGEGEAEGGVGVKQWTIRVYLGVEMAACVFERVGRVEDETIGKCVGSHRRSRRRFRYNYGVWVRGNGIVGGGL